MPTFDQVVDFDFFPGFGGSFSDSRLFATIGPRVYYLQNNTYPWIDSGGFTGIDRFGFVKSVSSLGAIIYVGREDQGGGNAEVYRSVDAGVNYSLDYTILNMAQVSAGIIDFNTDNLFVGTTAFASGAAEIHKRTPGGLWSLVHTFFSPYYKVTDFLQDPFSGFLYATVSYDGSQGGQVFESQDGGTTWNSVFNAVDFDDDYPILGSLEYFNGNIYVLASSLSFIKMFTSPDGISWSNNASFPVVNFGDVGTDMITDGVTLLAGMGNISSSLGINAKTYCTTDGLTWGLDKDFNIPPVNNGTGFTTESSITALGYDFNNGKYYCGIGNIGFPETSTFIYSCPTADIGAPAEPSGGG